MVTTTFGTGLLIKNAIDKGAKKIILGIGGSATNDGGTGMLEALGLKFFEDTDQHIQRLSGENLSQIKRLESPAELPVYAAYLALHFADGSIYLPIITQPF